MHRLFFIFSFGLFIWILSSMSVCADPAKDSTVVNESPRFSMSVRGNARHFDRGRNFKIANTGNWGNVVLNGLDGNEQTLVYNSDRWSGGYGIDLTVSGIDSKMDFQASFEQSFLRREETKTNLPGTGAGVLTTMAFIDGKAHGTGQTFGFFVTANPLAGRNSPGEAKLKFGMNNASLSLLGLYRAVDGEHFLLSILAGPAYSRFEQRYLFLTSGANSSNGSLATSRTDEVLVDHLLGGMLGVDASLHFLKRLYFKIRQSFGLYARLGRLNVSQEVVNVGGNAGGGVQFTSLIERITVRDRNVDFVPQFQSDVSLGLDLNKQISLNLFYRFDAWLNVSRIHNPVITANLRALKNSSTEIEDESLFAHAIGGKIVIRF